MEQYKRSINKKVDGDDPAPQPVTYTNIFGTAGNYEGTAGEQVPVNSVNHLKEATKTFSTAEKTVGNTSMRMLAANQPVHARSNNTTLTQGKYYLWYLDRYVKSIQSNVFPMAIYNIDGTGYQLVSSTNTSDANFVTVGGVFEGRNGGVRLMYGRSALWTGEVYVDNNTLIEISKADHDAVKASTMTLTEIINKYKPVTN